jgi:hypothetical protein
MRPMATAEPVRSLPASTLTRLMCCYIREKMYILRLCAQSDTFKVLNHRVYTCHIRISLSMVVAASVIFYLLSFNSDSTDGCRDSAMTFFCFYSYVVFSDTKLFLCH